MYQILVKSQPRGSCAMRTFRVQHYCSILIDQDHHCWVIHNLYSGYGCLSACCYLLKKKNTSVRKNKWFKTHINSNFTQYDSVFIILWMKVKCPTLSWKPAALTILKCNILLCFIVVGVCCHTTILQHNYVIPKAEWAELSRVDAECRRCQFWIVKNNWGYKPVQSAWVLMSECEARGSDQSFL